MRRVVVLALLALALPMAAWADEITFTNQFGTVSATDSGIISKGSQLTSYNGIQAPKGHALGTVSYATGALLTGSIATGGTFSATGSSFDIVGNNKLVPKGPIFTGAFTTAVDPITWTLVNTIGQEKVFDLHGDITGTLYNGRVVSGSTTQTIDFLNGQHFKQGMGHIKMGSGTLTTPEPGTLGLLGTGLLGLAGIFRRKKV